MDRDFSIVSDFKLSTTTVEADINKDSYVPNDFVYIMEVDNGENIKDQYEIEGNQISAYPICCEM